MPVATKNTRLIKEEAYRLGFLHCGVAKADFLEEEAPRLEKWLSQNYQGEMSYMANHFDKRLDPRLLVDGAKSVISLLLNYYPPKEIQQPGSPKISKYAYGQDYHFVIKDKLKELLHFIREEIGDVGGRAFVDSAPVMDKVWAQKAGLGWRAKHSNLVHPKHGSFFFLAELIVDLELDYDAPFQNDHCGSCTRCIDACPTDAITEPYVVDGSRCISYLTIELKNAIPEEFKGKMQNWAFGCDICQDVCPWNRFSQAHQEPAFEAHPLIGTIKPDEWTEISEEFFREVFRKSAVKRTKLDGFKRNLRFLEGENG
ncbi:MAG: tRNA epoxyqueuosine(34) reductase QueG [Mucilaginibacter polytrichastri]|nr:tRNA epoxyqueuosine(34) reductase QueG [Mucilaginibacter polytrichastri]